MELKNERNVDDDLEDMGMEKNELFDFVHWQRKEKEISWMVQKQAAMEGHTDSRNFRLYAWVDVNEMSRLKVMLKEEYTFIFYPTSGNNLHGLGDSVSLRRFASESLAWEKWSNFPHNRYVEEAKSYAQPGSVAEKKAFFEAYFNKAAAQKPATALLEQEKANAAATCHKSDVKERAYGTNHATHGLLTGISNFDSSQRIVVFHPIKLPPPPVLNLKMFVNERKQGTTQDASKVIDAAAQSPAISLAEPQTEKIVGQLNVVMETYVHPSAVGSKTPGQKWQIFSAVYIQRIIVVLQDDQVLEEINCAYWYRIFTKGQKRSQNGQNRARNGKSVKSQKVNPDKVKVKGGAVNEEILNGPTRTHLMGRVNPLSINEELEEYIKPPSWNLPTSSYDDDDDEENSIPLRDIIMSELPPCVAITPDSPITDSLIMEDKHLDTILKTESDKFIKSSVENLVQNPSESEDECECDVPDCDDSQTTNFSTFSNPLFAFLTSSDDESIAPIYSEKNDCFDAESYLLKSLLNRDTLMASSLKVDSTLDEFAGKLKTIPPGIVNREHEEYISMMERLLYDNSTPRPPEAFQANSDTIIESLPTFPIPVEDSDSLREEIDIFPVEIFLFDLSRFQEFSTIDVVEDIPVDVPNILPTHPTLHMDFDFIPSHNDLGSDLDVSSPSGDRNKIYDPGICIEVKSMRFLTLYPPPP
ncbi:hypothetical protein Tco_1392858 [Tanacetum coccineum]